MDHVLSYKLFEVHHRKMKYIFPFSTKNVDKTFNFPNIFVWNFSCKIRIFNKMYCYFLIKQVHIDYTCTCMFVGVPSIKYVFKHVNIVKREKKEHNRLKIFRFYVIYPIKEKQIYWCSNFEYVYLSSFP